MQLYNQFEILHFQKNLFGGACQKFISSLHACKSSGPYRSPFFHTYWVDSSDVWKNVSPEEVHGSEEVTKVLLEMEFITAEYIPQVYRGRFGRKHKFHRATVSQIY